MSFCECFAWCCPHDVLFGDESATPFKIICSGFDFLFGGGGGSDVAALFAIISAMLLPSQFPWPLTQETFNDFDTILDLMSLIASLSTTGDLSPVIARKAPFESVIKLSP